MTVIELDQKSFADKFRQVPPASKKLVLDTLTQDLAENFPIEVTHQTAIRDIILHALQTTGDRNSGEPQVRESSVKLASSFLARYPNKISISIVRALFELATSCFETADMPSALRELFPVVKEKRKALFQKVFDENKQFFLTKLEKLSDEFEADQIDNNLCAIDFHKIIGNISKMTYITAPSNPFKKKEIQFLLSLALGKKLAPLPLYASDDQLPYLTILFIKDASTHEKKDILKIAYEKLESDVDMEENKDTSPDWMRRLLAIDIISYCYQLCKSERERETLFGKKSPFNIHKLIRHQRQQIAEKRTNLRAQDCLPLMTVTIETAGPQRLMNYVDFWRDSLRTLDTKIHYEEIDNFLKALLTHRGNDLGETKLLELKEAIEQAPPQQRRHLSSQLPHLQNLLTPQPKQASPLPKGLRYLLTVQS